MQLKINQQQIFDQQNRCANVNLQQSKISRTKYNGTNYDYVFTYEKTWKESEILSFLVFQKISLDTLLELNDTVLWILCLKHKGKLLVDWNKEQMYTTVAPAAFDARQKLTKLSLLMKI